MTTSFLAEWVSLFLVRVEAADYYGAVQGVRVRVALASLPIPLHNSMNTLGMQPCGGPSDHITGLYIRFSLAYWHRGSSPVSLPNDQLLIFGLIYMYK